jgi:hypothetical protein
VRSGQRPCARVRRTEDSARGTAAQEPISLQIPPYHIRCRSKTLQNQRPNSARHSKHSAVILRAQGRWSPQAVTPGRSLRAGAYAGMEHERACRDPYQHLNRWNQPPLERSCKFQPKKQGRRKSPYGQRRVSTEVAARREVRVEPQVLAQSAWRSPKHPQGRTCSGRAESAVWLRRAGAQTFPKMAPGRSDAPESARHVRLRPHDGDERKRCHRWEEERPPHR